MHTVSWTDREREKEKARRDRDRGFNSLAWLGSGLGKDVVGKKKKKVWIGMQIRSACGRAELSGTFRRTGVHLPLISHAVNEELGESGETGVGAATEWE